MNQSKRKLKCYGTSQDPLSSMHCAVNSAGEQAWKYQKGEEDWRREDIIKECTGKMFRDYLRAAQKSGKRGKVLLQRHLRFPDDR